MGLFKKKNSEVKTDYISTNEMGFAVRESYKQLRTNLEFSLPDVEGCKIIGVTSAGKGEGKSTTSIRLAGALAEAQKRVLLIEGDLRLPTFRRRFGIKAKEGISDKLIRGGKELKINNIKLDKEENGASLDVVICGSTPPNPSEILGSDAMGALLNELKRKYDYILVDFPPITLVSDTLAASKFLHGVVMVVRQNFTETSDLAEAMMQLEFGRVKLLGFVYNCARGDEFSYRIRYKYRHRYYKYGGYKYGYHYGSYAAKQPNEETKEEEKK